MSVGEWARRLLSAVALSIATIVIPGAIHAQLRPLDAPDWRLISGTPTISASLGASAFSGQRASLAGTSGTLWELGAFSIAWRTGRVVLEAAGTAQRFFRESSRFTEPYADVEPSSDGRRNDSGDYRISTSVRVTPDGSPVAAALRFGTRLPTTDNRTGLDRDALDFFATIGARTGVAALALSGNVGLGINTTREPRFEQEDVLIYSLLAELEGYPLTPSVAVLGQWHGTTHAPIRGTEDLGEIRIGVRAGSRYWIRLEAVKGYETFSPEGGAMVTVGSTLNLANPGGR